MKDTLDSAVENGSQHYTFTVSAIFVSKCIRGKRIDENQHHESKYPPLATVFRHRNQTHMKKRKLVG